MTTQRQLLFWVLAALLASLLLIAILVWRHRTAEEFWSTFLAGDPEAGAVTFREKGCRHCHAVNGAGGNLAPDLGFEREARSTLSQLVTELWNHAPRMWAQMEKEQLSYPRFSRKEMADLFAYLYTARYAREPGDVHRGHLLFTLKSCDRCHSIRGGEGKLGPSLTQLGPVDTPIFWAQTMWNHAPAMETHMREMKIDWPTFEGEEMNDLLAYIRLERGGPQREFDLLPASPDRGRALFRDKACIMCHAIAGEGGTLAPDLGSGTPLPHTLTQAAGLMWNHSPAMWAAMKARSLERPTFEGQEMADLIAYLYSVRYFELAGSPGLGRQVFAERGCSRCHGDDARGSESAPDLRGRVQHQTPVTLAQALWMHGPRMFQRSREQGLEWPILKEGDLQHLLAFLNTPPDAFPP